MFEVYNEKMERMEAPDLSLGWLEESKRTEHHEAIDGVDEVWHYQTVHEYANGGKVVKKIIDIPGIQAMPAWDEEISIKIFHPYSKEELNAIEAEKLKPTQLDLIEAQCIYTAMNTGTLLQHTDLTSKIQKWVLMKLWTDEMLEDAVNAGVCTQSDF